MNHDLDKLQRMLEQATAGKEAAGDRLDPETASLREAWLNFGELLQVQSPEQASPLPLGEGPGVRVARRVRRHNKRLATAALLAASLLIAAATMWLNRSTNEPAQAAPHGTASTGKTEAPHKTTQVAAEPQWDDAALDEQIAQVGQNIIDAQRDQYTAADPFSSLRYGIEQVQKDLDANKL